MPRKNPIPARETAICLRVRAFRTDLRLSRVALASVLNVNTLKLANIEHERTLLRFDIAAKLINGYNLNPRWLAEGTSSILSSFRIEHELNLRITPSLLFSEAYDLYLKTPVQQHEMLAANIMSAGYDLIRQPPGLPQEKDYKTFAMRLVGKFLEPLERTEQGRFVGKLLAMLNDFQADARTNCEKPLLTYTSEFRNSNEMKSALKQLLDNVRKLTEPTGMKAKLAVDLGVPQARVTEWLTGKHEPSGQTTLELLGWISEPKNHAESAKRAMAEEAKQKQKSAAVQSTPLRRKTRSTQSSYEKRKPSPKKR